MRVSSIIAFALVFAGLLMTLSACSEMERSGVSNRPQNCPSSWETQKGNADVGK